MAKKRTKWSTNFFFPKEPYFWKKEHNFHPKTIFFYIFIHKFFWKCQNVAIFFGFYRWFLVFFKKFSKKVYFTVLQRSTKFFQRATRLWKSHQCATKRTLLNTLVFFLIFICASQMDKDWLTDSQSLSNYVNRIEQRLATITGKFS